MTPTDGIDLLRLLLILDASCDDIIRVINIGISLFQIVRNDGLFDDIGEICVFLIRHELT